MDAKLLKKLADTCRKAGIKQYKCAEFEFTLTDDVPISNYKKRQRKSPNTPQSNTAVDDLFESDSLTEEQLLMWSAGDPPSES